MSDKDPDCYMCMRAGAGKAPSIVICDTCGGSFCEIHQEHTSHAHLQSNTATRPAPQPHHPQKQFGSGVQTWSLAYPHLAAYGYDPATFTTLDLLDSLAARLKIVENALAMGEGEADG